MQVEASSPSEHCHHCGLEAFNPVHNHEHVFCCHGCSQVYQLLHDQGLENFYELKKEGVNFSASSPVQISDREEFLYLDQSEFFEKYGKTLINGNKQFSFYIEGVNCLACIWLLDRLPHLNREIVNSQYDLSVSKLDVEFKNIPLSLVASLITQLGYKAYPLKNEQERKLKEKQENRNELIRLAVSGMCAGNIMLFAISLYGGAVDSWEKYFQWACLALSLPVLTYGALPFYRNFMRDIRSLKISLDTPIVLSIVFGSMMGVYNIFRGNPEIYFDTLTILVFLLLSSRFLLRKVKQKGLQLNHLTDYFVQSWARKWNQEKMLFEKVPVEQIHPGDKIQVNPGELVPADGTLFAGEALINTSLITGEFSPQKISLNHPIYSGTQVVDLPIELTITNIGKETRIGKILEEVKKNWHHDNSTVRLTDKIARYLVSAVLVFAIALFSYLALESFDIAFSRTLALIIITCPCALGLATPLAMVLGMKRAASQGIIIKSDEALEKANHSEKIFLDKTGTITYGRFQVTHWDGETPFIRSIVQTLEANSRHPIAQSLIEYIAQKKQDSLELSSVQEILGSGVMGQYKSEIWQIKTLPISEIINSKTYQTRIGIYCNNKLVSNITLEDKLRTDVIDILPEFQNKNLSINILSGDNENSVKHIGHLLGLDNGHLYYNAGPEAKKQILQASENSIMVGDGANDALALSAASIGIAVQGSMAMSLKVADVYLTNPGIKGVIDFIKISKSTMNVVKRNIVFSLLYNTIGITAACLGFVGPLWAAIFMPLSSITVVLSTIAGTRELREIGKHPGSQL